MKFSQVREILEAEVLCGNDLLHKDVHSFFPCDRISEMLLSVTPDTLVIISLTNIHIVHTAQVMDSVGVVSVGDKKTDGSVTADSEINNNPLFTTRHPTFECCCGHFLLNNLKDNAKNYRDH